MSIARALALGLTRGKSINDFRPDGDPFFALGGGDSFGLPNPFILFLVMAVIAWVVLSRTVFGRQLYAVGGNEKAARLSGLDVDRLKITVYVVSAADGRHRGYRGGELSLLGHRQPGASVRNSRSSPPRSLAGLR